MILGPLHTNNTMPPLDLLLTIKKAMHVHGHKRKSKLHAWSSMIDDITHINNDSTAYMQSQHACMCACMWWITWSQYIDQSDCKLLKIKEFITDQIKWQNIYYTCISVQFAKSTIFGIFSNSTCIAIRIWGCYYLLLPW